ncbi:hypothetical protein [Methylobacterium sp. A54F]
MFDAQEQLVAALRAIVAQSGDAHALVIHALEDVERERSERESLSDEAAHGPYGPNALSIFAERLH